MFITAIVLVVRFYNRVNGGTTKKALDVEYEVLMEKSDRERVKMNFQFSSRKKRKKKSKSRHTEIV